MGDEDDDAAWFSSSNSTPSYRFRWDVFLSFRGEDTRHNFTERLYNELVLRGVRTFRDDEGLERGEEIAPSLVDAIKDSAASIAVISENYANSKWCLEELAVILECKRLMLPVFYEVDPSDVRRQKGPFETDFRNHDTDVAADKVSRWRDAMSKAGRISGWDSRTWNELDLIHSLVKKIMAKLNDTPLGVAKYPVGISSRLDILLRKLDVKGNGVRIIGFHGMGGIGKTTLAKALFNKLVSHFKTRSFISNVRQISQDSGLTYLQSKFLGDVNSTVPPTIHDFARGIIYIKEAVHDKPVLLVLDDIDDANQLNALAGGRDWFYEGSRIIITTRTKEVLPQNIVDEVYEVNGLIYPEALQLFSYHAFGREKPNMDFMKLSEQIVNLTGGLPLALEVIGSSMFYKRRKTEWIDELEKLKQIRPNHLQDVLEISFKGLDDQEKCVFLDLACFFVNSNLIREDAIDIFKGCGFNAEVAITDLTARSLVKIIEGNVLWMHDQIRDMGRQIVQRESYADAGKRSRLWSQGEIMMVLKNRKGTRSIEGITLDFGKKQKLSSEKADKVNTRKFPALESAVIFLKKQYKKWFGHTAKEDGDLLNTESFKGMVNLRLLQINHAKLEGNFEILPAELKWLQWKGCPLESLPSALCSRDVAILDISQSSIVQLWGHSFMGHWQRNKMTKKLFVVNASNCYHLKEIPDLSGFCLEKLILEHCKGLVKIHHSLGDMGTLTYLNLKECENLLELPSDISGLRNLEKLILSGCINLRELPEDLSGLRSLKELLLDRTPIMKLPDTIFRLKNLEVFNLAGCYCLDLLPHSIGNLNSLRELILSGTALQKLPDSIGNLSNLELLNLRMCKSLSSISNSIGNLTSLVELCLDRSSIKELPASIGSISHLKFLMLGHCRSLSKLPDSIGRLSSLVSLQLEGTQLKEIPDQVGALNNLEQLNLGSIELLDSIPGSIGGMLSLRDVELDNLSIAELPESIGLLERLDTLKLNNCKNLRKLPASIGNLASLRYLYMDKNAVTELPDEIGRLSRLKVLRMAKQPDSGAPNNNGRESNQTDLVAEHQIQPVVLPKSFSGLSSLEELDARSWRISGKLSDDLEKLSSLQTLNLGDNDFRLLPSSLRGLSVLKKLLLPKCKELKLLPPLPSSLVELNVANCYALEYLADISSLGNLEELQLTNCKKITDIPGLECLKSLRRLYTGGCNSCLPAIKKRLSKDALRHIIYLCVPGTEIPSWFAPELPRFSIRKNLKLKAVIIGVVVSLDQQVEDNFRKKLPAIVDIQAKIIRLNDAIFTKTLYLLGVPDTDEDQLYLCRFHEFQQLVFMLEDGDKIAVTMRENPRFNGLKLKKHGIHLVFEGDDDYDENDEELFDESHQSVSKKLANFFSSL
ncbi:disease resistance protein TAO1 [Coffea eugenioides]|uniref:disease resistance protein TAO1 n=1 Tax=Coffea eugenioides TaxID=49369 RepID=UPI000F6062EA|nr:disease resistance protein TAO1 [Coffea eugenioides]